MQFIFSAIFRHKYWSFYRLFLLNKLWKTAEMLHRRHLTTQLASGHHFNLFFHSMSEHSLCLRAESGM